VWLERVVGADGLSLRYHAVASFCGFVVLLYKSCGSLVNSGTMHHTFKLVSFYF